MTSSNKVNDANPFIYTKLDDPSSQVRLLRIPLDVPLYLTGTSTTPLRGTLSTYDIPSGKVSKFRRLARVSKLPLFHALSYVWGDPAKTHEILVDGKRLAITRNLYLALRSMQSGVDGVIRIWADAICIDQGNELEKSAQIQLMREIYLCASEVRIWLGLLTPEVKRCLRFMIDLTGAPFSIDEEPTEINGGEHGAMADTFSYGLISVPISAVTTFVRGGKRLGQGLIDTVDAISTYPSMDDSAKLIEKAGLDRRDTSLVPEFASWQPALSRLQNVERNEPNLSELAELIDKFLIQQSWYLRMWVVQEFCCSRSVQVQVGRTTLQWEYFMKSIHYLHFIKGYHMNNLPAIQELECIRRGWTKGERQSLRDLVRTTRHRGSTDPRDKIYSLYGLMGDHIGQDLRPDYTLSVAEVYTKATHHFLTQSKSLDCLFGWKKSTQNQLNSVPNLPSWVPDYSLSQTEVSTPLVSTDRWESIYGASGYSHQAEYTFQGNAGASPSPDLSTLSKSNIEFPKPVLMKTIKVRGIWIDSIATISHVSPANVASPSQDLSLELIAQSWLSALLQSAPLQSKLTPENCELLSIVSSIANFYLSSQTQERNGNSYSFPTSHTSSTPLPPQPRSTLLTPPPVKDHSILQDHLGRANNAEEESLPISYLRSLLCDRAGHESRYKRLTKHKLREIINLSSSRSAADSLLPVSQIREAFVASMLYRCLAVTKKGYLVVVPNFTQIGDEAVILFGASVVSILRRFQGTQSDSCSGTTRPIQENSYTLIGEAYMHGFMDGETIAMCRKNVLHESDFILH